MKFIHFEFDAGPDHVVRITLDNQANVRLMDDKNFKNYSSGQIYKHYGKFVTTSPHDIIPPKKGHWNIVVDLGGQSGKVKAAMDVFRVAKNK
jgi:hypothetical protein